MQLDDESTTVRKIERGTPIRAQLTEDVPRRRTPAINATAEELEVHIVDQALTHTRNSLEELRAGLKFYKILDAEDASGSQDLVDGIDNLVRRVKRFESQEGRGHV